MEKYSAMTAFMLQSLAAEATDAAFCMETGPIARLLAPSLGYPGLPRLRHRLCTENTMLCASALNADAVEPLLKRRRRRSKGAPDSPASSRKVGTTVQEMPPRGVLGVLSATLVAVVMSYVDVKTKVRNVRLLSHSLRQAMQCRTAWDPLCLDQATGRSFLRLLKRCDPLGCFVEAVNKTKRLLPRGIFEVTRLEAVLMDPERVELEQSDTEDDIPKPRPMVIADPLDEVCKRLRNYFTSVSDLYVSNIEDYRMDYRFVGLRAGSLADFGYVELEHRPTSPATYSLLARRTAPPRQINLEAMKKENRSRMPAGVPFDDTTTISEREALYLVEHRSAYKNGDDFHLVHAAYRTVRSHGVRRKYKAVVESLRDRFPEQFTSRADPNSPSHGSRHSGTEWL